MADKNKVPSAQSSKSAKWWQKGLRILVIILGTILGLIFLLLFIGQIRPLQLNQLKVSPQPITNWDEANVKAQALVQKDKDNPELNPDCATRYLSQGKKVERVLVIRHGLTNCPRQFDELAREYYNRGYNVLITRIPKHGLKDRKSPVAATLTAQEALANFSNSIDIAHGLGEKIDLLGLSVGANEVAEMAVQRDDINQATMINPFFGIKSVPPLFTRSVCGIMLTLPNVFMWWDNAAKENLAGPTSAYYGFYTHVIGQYLRMTIDLERGNRPLQAKQPIVITNGNDDAVNNRQTEQLVRQWKRTGAQITTYQFPASDKLNHDLIDPMQPDANTSISYPKILELTTGI